MRKSGYVEPKTKDKKLLLLLDLESRQPILSLVYTNSS